MSFSQKLALKYATTQKRHSVFTILSITTAVVFITVMFVMFSSILATLKNAYTEKWPWHAEIYRLSEEQAQVFKDSDMVVKWEYEVSDTSASDGPIPSKLRLVFNRDIYDPTTFIRDTIDSYVTSADISYVLNGNLLAIELIGVHAKANFVMVFAFFYIFVLIFMFCARFIVDTAFEISAKEREIHYGLLSSLGASKKQITRIILWEGIFLSVIAIPVGIALGTGISYIVYDAIIKSDVLKALIQVEQSAGRFSAPPIFLVAVAVSALVWVMLSAYGTGMRYSKKPPIEIIRNSGERIRKVKKSRILGRLFGIEGTLASRNVRRNKKRFTITVLSITVSFILSTVLSTLAVYYRDMMDYYYSDFLKEPYYHYSIDYYPYKDNGDDSTEWEFSSEDIKDGYKLLEDSGYFKSVSLIGYAHTYIESDELAFDPEMLEKIEEYDYDVALYATYFNENEYNRFFDNNPPVPYSELIGGNYIVVGLSDGYDDNNKLIPIPDKSPVDFEKDGSFTGFIWHTVPESELVEGEEAELFATDDESGISYYNVKREGMSGNIIAYTDAKNGYMSYGDLIYLIGAQEEYFRLLDNKDSHTTHLSPFKVLLTDEQCADYEKANENVEAFIKENECLSSNSDTIQGVIDLEKISTAITVIGIAVTLLVTLTALINEVNIISTGILNRRREIAAMRSLGMSKGQLTKMLLLECGLYSVISAFATIVIIEPLLAYINNLVFGNQAVITVTFSYIAPVVSVLLLLIPIFAAAVITTFVSVAGFGRNPISEEMRMVE